MTIKMLLAAVGTLAMLSDGVAIAQTPLQPTSRPQQPRRQGAAHGEVAGMLEAGRREGPARQGAQEVPEPVQEGLTRLCA